MENSKNELSETKQKILKGLDLVFKKLIETKKKNNGELVVLKDGIIQRIQAADIDQ